MGKYLEYFNYSGIFAKASTLNWNITSIPTLNSMYSYRQKGDTRLKKKGKTSLRPFNSLHRTECHLSLLTLVTLQINH